VEVKIYKTNNADSCILEIVDLKSDNLSDTLTHFVPPLGCPEIIFYIGKTHQIKNVPCEKGFIKGQYTTAQKIYFASGYHFLSVRLQPYGLKQLLNMDVSELQNAVMAIEEHPTSELIWNFISKQTIIDVDFLKKFVEFIDLLAVHFISTATLEFIKSLNETEIKTIKSSIIGKGFSLRTLQRNFKKEVGLTPKEFLKISRMNAIERQMVQNKNIFEIIANFDFTDQSHLNKEFKQLRNNTPKDLKRKKLFLQDQLPIPEIIML
jgi:AraC-like DNA-binding protein